MIVLRKKSFLLCQKYILSCGETHMVYCIHMAPTHSVITAGVANVAWKSLAGL